MHSEVVRMFGGNSNSLQPLTAAQIDEWYTSIEMAPHAWMIEYEGRCIGSVRLHSLDDAAGSARYAVGILDPQLLGKGLGREVSNLVLAYAFETLRLRRVDLRVLSYNLRAIRSYESCGFVRVATEQRAVYADGNWHDDIIMAINAGDWLNRTAFE